MAQVSTLQATLQAKRVRMVLYRRSECVWYGRAPLLLLRLRLVLLRLRLLLRLLELLRPRLRLLRLRLLLLLRLRRLLRLLRLLRLRLLRLRLRRAPDHERVKGVGGAECRNVCEEHPAPPG